MEAIVVLIIIFVIISSLADSDQNNSKKPVSAYDLQSLVHDDIYRDDLQSPPEGIGDGDIYRLCRYLGITRVCHFTHIDNMESILDHGILCRDTLEREGIRYRPSDDNRIDTATGYVPMSIEHPNNKMLWSKIMVCPESPKDWVVLYYHPAVLWRLNCRFLPGNASRKDILWASGNCEGTAGLKCLYYDEEVRMSAGTRAACSHPVDIQSEVLVHDRVPAEYLAKLNYCTYESYSSALSECKQEMPESEFQLIKRLLDVYDMRGPACFRYRKNGTREVASPIKGFDRDDIPF